MWRNDNLDNWFLKAVERRLECMNVISSLDIFLTKKIKLDYFSVESLLLRISGGLFVFIWVGAEKQMFWAVKYSLSQDWTAESDVLLINGTIHSLKPFMYKETSLVNYVKWKVVCK